MIRTRRNYDLYIEVYVAAALIDLLGTRLCFVGKVAVHANYFGVQASGKGHKRKVRQHERAGGCVCAGERGRAGSDCEPEHSDLHQRSTPPHCIEEDERPRDVQRELHHVQRHARVGQNAVHADSRFVHKKGRVAHTQIERRPDRAERKVGRREPRLAHALVPTQHRVARHEAHKHARNQRREQQNHEHHALREQFCRQLAPALAHTRSIARRVPD
mmetsp:Transcript_1171/g.3308  ORF Transcript_1171/g.3308 Transcript_1171/m.3308 type:complete len:216 (+) Transcript_1171:577-1224(+)